MNLSFTIASPNDAALIATLKSEAAKQLTERYGQGHWSYQPTEKSVLSGMTGTSKVLIAMQDDMIAGTLRLTTKKPWAIDPGYFTRVRQPLYLVDMAVHPAMQRRGVGKYMLQNVKQFAAAWPAQAIRLDAYDAAAGAGEFYQKCGFNETGHVVYRKVPLIYFEMLFLPHRHIESTR